MALNAEGTMDNLQYNTQGQIDLATFLHFQSSGIDLATFLHFQSNGIDLANFLSFNPENLHENLQRTLPGSPDAAMVGEQLPRNPVPG